MKFTDISVKIPVEAARYIETSIGTKSSLREQALLLYPSISDLSLSYGRAAKLLGISKRELIDLYSGLGIPYISVTWEDVQNDMATYRAIRQKELEKNTAV